MENPAADQLEIPESLNSQHPRSNIGALNNKKRVLGYTIL